MTMPTKENRKMKLNAMDYFIIIALILCVLGAAIRVALHAAGGLPGTLGSSVVMEEYIVSFKISNIRNTSTSYLTDGEVFYQKTTRQLFGTVEGNVSVTPALFYIEDINGNYIQTYAPENGDATRVDVTGTIRVSGYMSESGFLLNGNTPLVANKAVELLSKNLAVTITVTDIAKAS